MFIYKSKGTLLNTTNYKSYLKHFRDIEKEIAKSNGTWTKYLNKFSGGGVPSFVYLYICKKKAVKLY
jgi:hypothetical protein